MLQAVAQNDILTLPNEEGGNGDIVPRITLETVREVLSYEPETGVFNWRKAVANVPAGAIAGSLKNGNRYIRIGEVDFLARRLAWLFVHGNWPTHNVSMLNGKKDDCRADNLGVPKSAQVRARLSPSRLRAALDYDQTTGVFIWKEPGHREALGERAGWINQDGYRYIKIDGADFMAARLAWFWVHGEWPLRRLKLGEGGVDDCRIANLSHGAIDRSVPAERNAYDRSHRLENPDYYRAVELKKSFDITLDQYQALFISQSGLCAICALPERDTRNGKVKWLAVDHDHETGLVRALLCVACNTALGKLGDSADRLDAAAAYLRRHAAPQALAANIARTDPVQNSSLRLCHVELKVANEFIEALHRHHGRIQGHRFSLGAEIEGRLVGVIVVGRPVGGQHAHDWAEVTRLCTDGTKNACSFLYAAAGRAAASLGFSRIQTFILRDETGVSLKASGWQFDRLSHAVGWHHDGPRAARKVEGHLMDRKQLWYRDLATHGNRAQRSETSNIVPIRSA